jgi:hypothetical protein
MAEEEIVVNLREEIEKYAAPVNHTHTAYTPVTTVTTTGTKAVQSKGIVKYINSVLNNFPNKSEVTSLIEEKISNAINITMSDYVKTTSLANYLTTENAESEYAKKTDIPSDINFYAHPTTTTTKIDNLILPGYYQYVGNDATFSCKPDNVHYTNGLIKVEQQSNHLIQHVYATSYSSSAQKYKIDGREFVRYGYTSTTNDTVTKNWGQWRVANIPWKKRNDLLKNRGTNVSENGFSIYECTAGYVFKWQQSGEQQKYTLPMNQYDYGSIYTFEELPIVSPYIFGNLIGRIDVKITENDFKIRSTSKRNEDIVGVDNTYFVPRIN